MSTSTILPIRPQVQSESDDTAGVWLDWSEAASPAVLRAPRTQLPAYVYRGLTGSHWDGQRCDLVAPDDAGQPPLILEGLAAPGRPVELIQDAVRKAREINP